MGMDDGIEFLIGGNNAGLKKALTDAEKAIAASNDRAVNIVKKLVEKEEALYKSATDKRIAELEREGAANHSLILEQVKDRKAAEALILKNAKQIEEQITRVHKAEADKRAADEANATKRANAERARAEKAAQAEREHIEKETNRRIAEGRAALGGAATAAFAGLSLGIGASVKAFGDFESTVNQMAAVSNLTGKELEQVKAVALAMGAQTKYSAVEAAQGMSELAKAGFTAQESMKAIPGVLSLAAAGGLSVAKAAEIAGGAMQGFGLAADQAGRVADVLAKAANVSSVDVTDLGDSYKNVAPLARAAGQSFEEVTTALAVMGDNLIKSGEAGTSMKAALAILLNPSKDAQATLHNLGLSIQDTAGKMLPLSDIVQQLRDKTASMTEVQKASTIANIFGNDAVAGMLALMNKAPEAYNRTASAIRNATGASEEMAAVMNRGIKGSFEQLSGSVDTLLIQFGADFAPVVLSVADALTSLANGLGDIDPTTRALIAAVAAGAAALAGFGAVAAGVGLAIPVVTAGFVALGAAGSPLILTIGALSLAIAGLTGATALLGNTTEKTESQLRTEMETVNDLVTEFDRLRVKTGKTADEKDRMKSILAQINKIAPGVTGNFDAMGNATDIDRIALLNFNSEAENTIRILNSLANAKRSAASKTAANAQIDLVSAQADMRELQKRLSASQTSDAGTGRFYDPTGRNAAYESNATKALRAELRSKGAEVSALAGLARQANEARASLEKGTAPPRPVSGGGRVSRGGGYAAPAGRHHAAGGGKNTELQKQSDAVAKIVEKYRQATEVGKAFGGGTASEVKNLNLAIADLNKSGLAKTESGIKAIADAEHRLAVISGEVAKKEADRRKAIDARRRTQKQTDLTEDGRRVQTLGGKTAKDGKDFDKRIDEGSEAIDRMAERTRNTLRQLTGDITGLLLDPTQERWANFVRGFIQDESKLQGIVALGSDIETEFEIAGGGIDGAAAAVDLLSSSFDPLSFALSGFAILVDSVVAGMQQAKDNAQSIVDASSRLRQNLAQLSGKPEDVLGARKQAINDEEAAAVKPQWEQFQRENPFGWWTPEKQAEFENRISAIRELFKSERALADADFMKTVTDGESKSAEEATRALKDLTEQTEKLAAARDEMIGEHARDWADGIKELARLQDELNKGATDDRGNLIELAARRDLDLEKERSEWAKKSAEYAEKELEAEAEKAKIQKDRDEAIQKVRDEGIAQRAKTETQDKTERIAKITAEAAEKIKAQDEALEAMRAQKAEEADAHAKRIDFIQIEANRRIEAIGSETAAITAKLEVLNRELGIQLSIAAAVERSRAAADSQYKATTSAIGSNSTQTSYGPAIIGYSGTTAILSDGSTYSLPKAGAPARPQFDLGGVVPGPLGAKVTVDAHAGETIPPTHRTGFDVSRWAASMASPVPGGWFNGYRGAGGGGGTVNLGGIQINAAGGDLGNPMVVRSLVDVLDREMGRRIQQRGHRRI